MTTELVFCLDCIIGTGTLVGCAGCRQVEENTPKENETQVNTQEDHPQTIIRNIIILEQEFHNEVFVFLLRPREREETPVHTRPHTYISSFNVPLRSRFGSSTFVGPVCYRHSSVVCFEDVST